LTAQQVRAGRGPVLLALQPKLARLRIRAASVKIVDPAGTEILRI